VAVQSRAGQGCTGAVAEGAVRGHTGREGGGDTETYPVCTCCFDVVCVVFLALSPILAKAALNPHYLGRRDVLLGPGRWGGGGHMHVG